MEDERRELNNQLVVPTYRRFCEELRLPPVPNSPSVLEGLALDTEAMNLFNSLKPELFFFKGHVVRFHFTDWGGGFDYKKEPVTDFLQQAADNEFALKRLQERFSLLVTAVALTASFAPTFLIFWLTVRWTGSWGAWAWLAVGAVLSIWLERVSKHLPQRVIDDGRLRDAVARLTTLRRRLDDLWGDKPNPFNEERAVRLGMLVQEDLEDAMDPKLIHRVVRQMQRNLLEAVHRAASDGPMSGDAANIPEAVNAGGSRVSKEEDAIGSEWNPIAAERAIDELFQFARRHRRSAAFDDLLRFVARFPLYSPFNAMLVHLQMPGATFVAPPYRWVRDYRRRIRPGARPVVLLKPKGPVMFAFDVSDTEPLPGAPPLPPEVEHPFRVRAGHVDTELGQTVENAKRDGVRIEARDAGSQSAGQIGLARSPSTVRVTVRLKPVPEYRDVPVRYELLMNAKHPPVVQYVTLVHELAHLYCGHLGTPNDQWWSDRRELSDEVREFEAESVAFLVCTRLGIDNPSDEYLSGYVKDNSETPAISLDCVLKAAGLIEQMGRERMKLRKEAEA